MILLDTAVHALHTIFGFSILGQAVIHLIVNLKPKKV